MSISIKKWIGFGLLFVAVVLLSTTLKFKTTEAQTASSNACPQGTQLYGWIWSSNIGWVSLNSVNPGGGGGPHCVVIDASGNLKGWAWTSNLGWIKFGDLSGFPTVAGASTAGNAHVDNGTNPPQIVGWARVCSGTIKSTDPYLQQLDYPTHFPSSAPGLAGDCSTMTSRPDGWDGWIELGNASHALVYTTSQNSIIGYSWGNDVVDHLYYWLASTTQSIGSNSSCTISATQIPQTNSWKVAWQSSNTTYCVGTNFKADATSGNVNVTPSVTTSYSLWCAPVQSSSPAATCSATAVVSGTFNNNNNNNNNVGGCQGSDCGDTVGVIPDLQMWVRDTSKADNQSTAYVELKVGKTARLNWKSSSSSVTYSQCVATLIDRYSTSNPDNKGNSYFDPIINNAPIDSNGSNTDVTFTTAGDYIFGLTCKNDVTGKSTQAAVYDNGQTSLEIRVKDSNENEI